MGINAQVTELRAAKDRVMAETTSAGERVSALVESLRNKIAELGEVDPDISADVNALGAVAEQLKGIGVESAPTEPTEPTEPPVEPSPEEPGA